MTVRNNAAASPLETAVAQSFSKVLGLDVDGARTRTSRRSASSLTLTRIDDGWGGNKVVMLRVVLIILMI
jgi:hypothetical protein